MRCGRLVQGAGEESCQKHHRWMNWRVGKIYMSRTFSFSTWIFGECMLLLQLCLPLHFHRFRHVRGSTERYKGCLLVSVQNEIFSLFLCVHGCLREVWVRRVSVVHLGSLSEWVSKWGGYVGQRIGWPGRWHIVPLSVRNIGMVSTKHGWSLSVGV